MGIERDRRRERAMSPCLCVCVCVEVLSLSFETCYSLCHQSSFTFGHATGRKSPTEREREVEVGAVKSGREVGQLFCSRKFPAAAAALK